MGSVPRVPYDPHFSIEYDLTTAHLSRILHVSLATDVLTDQCQGHFTLDQDCLPPPDATSYTSQLNTQSQP